MKKEKVIEIHQQKILKSQQYLDFMEQVPMNKTISITAYPIVYPTWQTKKTDCIVKVIGFNKESVRVRVIAVEHMFFPVTSLKSENKTDCYIKIKEIQNFTWKEVPKKHLPLYIGYEYKSCLFEAILKGSHPI